MAIQEHLNTGASLPVGAGIRIPLVAAAGGIILTMLGIAAWAVVALLPESSGGAENEARSEAGSGAVPAELGRTIIQLKRFIEAESGLKFKTEVKVTLLSDEEFKERLAAMDEEIDKEAGDEELPLVMTALKMVRPLSNLDARLDELSASGIVGFYDFESNELVVRGKETTPFIRQVLVHELTHALQDQVFNLDRPELDSALDESFTGMEAVVEGDALRMEAKYLESLSPEERRQARLEEDLAGDPLTGDVPEVLLRLSGFPYEVGPSFVEALIDAGGRSLLDQALLTPPTSTEQLIHPERYLAGEKPVAIKAPPAGGELLEEGTFGELGLVLLLSDTLPESFVLKAADGWGGDYYVAWRKGQQSCTRIDMVMDSGADRSELLQALGLWANHHGDATLQRAGNAARLTACA